MIVLAIDTALEACAVAVLDTETEQLLAQQTALMKRGHAEALMPMIAQVMSESGIGFPQLDRIATTVGPGSFTGLRVGISAARGLGLAAGKPVVGVTTLAAYAAPAVYDRREEPIIVAIDARHDHVYTQTFSGSGGTLMKAAIIPIEETFRSVRFGAPRLLGNAAQILAERWPDHAEAPVVVETQPAPDIAWVAWVAASSDLDKAPARPLYLRAPDAKPKLEQSQARTDWSQPNEPPQQ